MNKSAARRRITSFAEYQKEHPIAHELPYWDFSEDTAILADGTLVLGAKLRGVSIETLDATQLNRLTLDFRSFLNSLPDGCELSFVCDVGTHDKRVLESHLEIQKKSEVVVAVGRERIEALSRELERSLLLRHVLYLFIYRRYDPPEKANRFSFFTRPKQFQEVTRVYHEGALREVRLLADGIFRSLDAAGIAFESLTSDDIRRLTYRFLNPVRSRSIEAPTESTAHRSIEFTPEERQLVPELGEPSAREQLAFSDMVCERDKLHYDGLFHRCITLKTLPEFTYSALISKLSDISFPYQLHVHIRVPEQSKELSALQAKRRMAHSMSLSQGGRATDLESEARLHSTEELLRELITTGQKLFFFQVSILASAETSDSLEQRTRAILSKFRELNGAEALAETVANLKVWKTMLPAGTTGIVRGKRVKTDNLADFLPLYEPYSGPRTPNARPVCLFRNRYQGLVQYDPFDALLPNYNALVTGSSGAGKSFINNLIHLQYAALSPIAYIIDIGGSYRKLCEFLGGQYVEISPPTDEKAALAINPFELPPGSETPSPQKIKFLMAFLETLFVDEEGKTLTKLERSVLEEAIIMLYSDTLPRSPRLRDLMKALSSSSEPVLRNFGRMLYPWTEDRPYGRLLDGERTFDPSASTVVFDLKGLSSYPDLQSVMILILTDFILGRVDNIKNRHKRIYMDECWELLKSRPSQAFMEYCVRTLRKSGSGITFITQGLEELIANPIGPAILSNTATKLVLLQRGNLEPVRSLLKLNEQEMSLISSLSQKKGYYSESFLIANDARTVIRIEPTPLEYWIATSDAADNQLLEERRRTAPNVPLSELLAELAREYPQGASGGKRCTA